MDEIEGMVIEEEEEEEDEVILEPRTRSTYLRSRSLELRNQRRLLRVQRSLRPRRTHRRISIGIGRDYTGLSRESRRRRKNRRVETVDGWSYGYQKVQIRPL